MTNKIKKWIKKHPTIFTLSTLGVITIINPPVGIGTGIFLGLWEGADRIINYLGNKIDGYFKTKELEKKIREERRQEIIEHNRKNTPHIELIKKNKKFYWKVKMPNKKIKYIPQRLGDRAENILTSLYARMRVEKVKT